MPITAVAQLAANKAVDLVFANFNPMQASVTDLSITSHDTA